MDFIPDSRWIAAQTQQEIDNQLEGEGSASRLYEDYQRAVELVNQWERMWEKEESLPVVPPANHAPRAEQAQGDDPSNALLDILSDLQTRVPATSEFLRSTGIGIAVNRLRTHNDPRVQKKADDLVNLWKRDIERGRALPRAQPANHAPRVVPGIAVKIPVGPAPPSVSPPLSNAALLLKHLADRRG